jgi:hypothetical protein
MRDTLMDESRARLVRPVTASVWSMIAVLVSLLTCAQAGDAHAQEILRWKLSAGEVLKYSNSQKTVMSVKRMGRERKQIRSHGVDYSWNVMQTAPNGDAQIVQRINHVSMKVEAPPYMPFEFDSNTPNADVPDPFELEVQQLKALIGAEFSFKMKPNGEIEGLTIPPATLKKLRDALPPEAVEQGAFSEQGLKDVLMQSSPPPFPLTPLEPGKSWSSKPSKVVMPRLGTLVSEKVFTFQGPDPKNPRVLIVNMEDKAALEPAENVEIKIRSQDGKGSLSFDPKAGCLINSRSVQKMELSASDMGQQSEQTTETTLTVTLVP